MSMLKDKWDIPVFDEVASVFRGEVAIHRVDCSRHSRAELRDLYAAYMTQAEKIVGVVKDAIELDLCCTDGMESDVARLLRKAGLAMQQAAKIDIHLFKTAGEGDGTSNEGGKK